MRRAILLAVNWRLNLLSHKTGNKERRKFSVSNQPEPPQSTAYGFMPFSVLANCATCFGERRFLLPFCDPLRPVVAHCILVLKCIGGAFMAQLIRTGEFAAIDLKHVHSADILYLDEEIDETLSGKTSNGGFAEIILDLRAGIIGLIKFIKTSKSEHRKTKYLAR